MNRYIALSVALIAGLLSAPHAHAELAVAKVVATCGTVSPTPHAGQTYALTMDVTGKLCSSGSGGGGGGAVTLAAGAVAAGAYTAGSFVSGSFLLGALADGAITTMGTEADTAWTSGSGTEISILKSIAGSAALLSPTTNITPTDCSTTSTGSAVNIIAAASTRHGATIANIDPTTNSGEPVWMSFVGAAVANAVGSFPLAPPATTTLAGMGSWTSPPGFGFNHAISVIASNGHKISCLVW